jgi:putative hemin transport protein
LSDLVCLDELVIETAGPALGVSHHASLAGLRCRNDQGVLDGAGLRLRLLLERVAAVVPYTAGQDSDDNPAASIALEDRNRLPLVVLRPPDSHQAAGFLIRTLMRAHGISGPGISPIAPAHAAGRPPPGDIAGDNDARLALDLAREVAGDGSGLDPLDAAEIAGPLSLHPQRLRARGEAVGVDPDLVASAIETLADNVQPLTLVFGNAGVVGRLDFSPFAARQGPGWQYVRGDRTSLRLDTRAIDSAWVFRRHDDPGRRRQLRVYDDSGRPIFMLSAKPTADGTDPAVWRALMNALLA